MAEVTCEAQGHVYDDDGIVEGNKKSFGDLYPDAKWGNVDGRLKLISCPICDQSSVEADADAQARTETYAPGDNPGKTVTVPIGPPDVGNA